MRLDHIGYITDQLEETKTSFLSLGYTAEETVDFEAHKCRICFLRKDGETAIELVEPYEGNKSLCKLLKNGVTPYHICYEVGNINEAIKELEQKGFVSLSKPLPAPAFDGREICYLWSREMGYIELVEK